MPAASISQTIRELAAAQKTPGRSSPPYSILVNRRLGRVFAAVAYHWGLTPNQVSLISAAFTFSGIATMALVRPNLLIALGITLLLVIGYGLDSADGQLARLRGGGSPAGEWLDHVLDSAKASAVHLAVLIGWFRFYDLRPVWLLIPIGYTVVSAVLFFGTWITERMRQENGVARATPPTTVGLREWIRRAMLLPTDYGILALIMVTYSTHNVFMALYAVMFAGNVGYAVMALPKWFRELSAVAR